MENVKKPSINNSPTIPSGGNTPEISSRASDSNPENAHIPTKRQQKAMNNLCMAPVALLSGKTNVLAQIASSPISAPNQPLEY